jgi:hypothetical protein
MGSHMDRLWIGGSHGVAAARPWLPASLRTDDSIACQSMFPLRPKNLRVVCAAIDVSDQVMLHLVMQARHVAADLIHILVAVGLEVAGLFHIVLKHFHRGHARHCGRNRQAHGNQQERIHVLLATFRADQ